MAAAEEQVRLKRDEDSTVYQGLDEAGRIQFILDMKQVQRNKEIEALLAIKPLTDACKIKIFKSIRFSYMTHDELLKLSMDPDFTLGKEMIMQGLSCKLNNYEHSGVTELLINLRPREVTQAQMADELNQNQQLPILAPNEGVNPKKT